MEATNEYPKTLLAITNGSSFLNIRDEFGPANEAALHNIEQVARDRAAKVDGSVIPFEVVGRNPITSARIVRNPFTNEVSEA